MGSSALLGPHEYHLLSKEVPASTVPSPFTQLMSEKPVKLGDTNLPVHLFSVQIQLQVTSQSRTTLNGQQILIGEKSGVLIYSLPQGHLMILAGFVLWKCCLCSLTQSSKFKFFVLKKMCFHSNLSVVGANMESANQKWVIISDMRTENVRKRWLPGCWNRVIFNNSYNRSIKKNPAWKNKNASWNVSF